MNSSSAEVHLIDDDKMLLDAISQLYELDGISVSASSSPTEFAKSIDDSFPAVVVTDVRMPKMDGFELFQEIKKIDPEIPVIFITGHADVPMVLDTLREGAFDFFSKPIDSKHLLASTRRAIHSRQLVLENRKLKALATKVMDDGDLIGQTPVMQRLKDMIQQVATADIDILIEGETGTGKDMVASLIHRLSGRSSAEFVSVNCAALPNNLAEAELFGLAEDPLSVTKRERAGKIESSSEGSLALHGIESLSESLQGQLLPVLENREITLVGAGKPKQLDLRVIASTKLDLSRAAENGEFRADVLYRLNTVHIKLPPLRERKDDIPLLFSHFLRDAANRLSKKAPKLDTVIQKRLLDYDWPGNVRELKNYAEALVLGIKNTDTPDLHSKMTLSESVAQFEAGLIRSTLETTKGDVKTTIEILGIPRKTFYDKVSRHEIDLSQYRIHVQ